MSGGFYVKLSALEDGRQAISGHAGEFGAVGDTFSGGAGSGSEFGTLSVSERLSGLTSTFHAVGGREIGAAQNFLSATATALHTARQSYTKANDGAAAAAGDIVKR
jgi:hypothetical protein